MVNFFGQVNLLVVDILSLLLFASLFTCFFSVVIVTLSDSCSISATTEVVVKRVGRISKYFLMGVCISIVFYITNAQFDNVSVANLLSGFMLLFCTFIVCGIVILSIS
mgnify:CR=1 FL=1